jgi:hypothetical protein
MGKPTVYLAGSIRNGVARDIEWRERAITRLKGWARVLNPLAGKTYHAATGQWTLFGAPPSGRAIVSYDFWSVDHADVLICDLRSLGESYPTLGTLVEFGRATARGALIFTVLPEGYCGHGNGEMYALHPFLAENSARVFTDMDECIQFVAAQLEALNGTHNRYIPEDKEGTDA